MSKTPLHNLAETDELGMQARKAKRKSAYQAPTSKTHSAAGHFTK